MKDYIARNRKEIITVGIIFIFFLLLRIPGVCLPYHQDEFKTAISVEQGSEISGNMFAHPPLTQLIYRLSYFVLGGERLRFYPIFFSSMSFFLIFMILRRKYDQMTSYIGLSVFSICFYSVWSSLMLDTDGAILPFFFLLSIYIYDLWLSSSSVRIKYIFGGLLLISLILGFLVKLSFIIVLVSIVFDYLFQKKGYLTKKHIGILLMYITAFLIISSVSIIFISDIYPSFKIANMIQHAKSFMHIGNRDYIQIVAQAIKALFYTSPFCLVPLLTSRELFSKMRIYYLYIVCGLFFYLVVFDFSRGALDKYLMYLIVPVCMISAPIIREIFRNTQKKWNVPIIPLVFGILLYLMNYVNNTVLPLYPKTYWFTEVFHLRLNFLNPFIGGSGPLGFYVSFLFISACFVFSIILCVLSLYKTEWRIYLCKILICVVIVYNLVFTSELLWGSINGSSSRVLKDTLSYIQSSQLISKVITYNDSGAYELTHMGKYQGRFYAVPASGDTHKKVFDSFNGYFLIIDIPHINEKLFHGQYFKKCDIVYQTSSGSIVGRIYTCRH